MIAFTLGEGVDQQVDAVSEFVREAVHVDHGTDPVVGRMAGFAILLRRYGFEVGAARKRMAVDPETFPWLAPIA